MQESQETQVRSLGQEDLLVKELATHCSVLAWRIPWTEDPDRLQSMGSQESDTTEQLSQVSQVALVVKNPAASAGDRRDTGSIPGSEGCPGGGHSSLRQ